MKLNSINWREVLKVVLTILTAIAGSLGVVSCAERRHISTQPSTSTHNSPPCQVAALIGSLFFSPYPVRQRRRRTFKGSHLEVRSTVSFTIVILPFAST